MSERGSRALLGVSVLLAAAGIGGVFAALVLIEGYFAEMNRRLEEISREMAKGGRWTDTDEAVRWLDFSKLNPTLVVPVDWLEDRPRDE